MRLLADERVPAPIVRRLRTDGFDVEHVVEDERGAEDPDVLARAGRTGRFLLTEDRDFGQLVYLQRAPASPGVVYLRLGGVPLEDAVEAVASVLSSDLVFAGRFTAISGTGATRPLPVPEP